MRQPNGYHVWYNIDPDMFDGDDWAHYNFIESDDQDDALWKLDFLVKSTKHFPSNNPTQQISYCIQAAKPESPFDWGLMATIKADHA